MSTKCPICNKSVRNNRKRLLHIYCLELTHVTCSNLTTEMKNKITSAAPINWTCTSCLFDKLLFKNRPTISETSESFGPKNLYEQCQISEQFQHDKSSFKVMHLISRSLISSFPEFTAFVNNYPFDVYTLSETWLTPNTHQIDYVKIPGLQLYNRNRSNKKGGGTAAYVCDNLEIKPRDDLSNLNLDSDVESLWFKIKGKNRNSDICIGVFYQPNFQSSLVQAWLDKFDHVLNTVLTNWNGITIITGDTNINFLKGSPTVTQHKDILQSYNLTPNITKPIRIGKLVIDHMISTSKCKVKVNYVIPCDEISHYDSPYIFLNAGFSKLQPRFRYIQDLSKFNVLSFIGDFQELPFNVVYAMDTVDDQVDLFNKLFNDCLEQHAPLSKKKVTHPPAQWLKDLEICNLKQTRNEFRYNANQTQSEDDWRKYRDVTKKLKKKIQTTKSNFFKNSLNSNRPNEVWKIIKS